MVTGRGGRRRVVLMLRWAFAVLLVSGGLGGGGAGADAAVIDPVEPGAAMLAGPAGSASAFERSEAVRGVLASAAGPRWDDAEARSAGLGRSVGDGASRPSVRGALAVIGPDAGGADVSGVATGAGETMPTGVVERVALVAWYEVSGRRVGLGLPMRELVPEIGVRPGGVWDRERKGVIEVVHGGKAADSGAGAGAPEGHVIPGPGVVGMLGAMAAAYAASRQVRGVRGR